MKTQPMRTLTISLTPQQREELRALELEHLKRANADGMASGKPVEVEPAEFIRGLKAERRARG
ncbi:MAG: hypothetical protein E5Y67_28935 [Mesorhizobium sp.]|nr:MAG: hypothetical protein E5Y67_28935 [Mesorhizobium sp.]